MYPDEYIDEEVRMMNEENTNIWADAEEVCVNDDDQIVGMICVFLLLIMLIGLALENFAGIYFLTGIE